jgi:peptide chain release factor 3
LAADSADMLIDGDRGVEPQTIKLFHVCRMRGIPSSQTSTKWNRANDPFDLMDRSSGCWATPPAVNWPIGTDGTSPAYTI